MILVLEKALLILEYIAGRDRPVFGREVARELEIPLPTCSRILRDLQKLGYLEQPSPRGGYRRGPVAYFLGRGEPYRAKLLEIARPLLREAARELQCTFSLSARNGIFRVTLLLENGRDDFRVENFWARHGLYGNCTGRVVAAYLPPAALKELLREQGLPTATEWPQAVSVEALHAELEQIRRDRLATREVEDENHTGWAAAPVFRKHEFAAVIGFVCPARDRDRLLPAGIEKLRFLAAELGRRLDRLPADS